MTGQWIPNDVGNSPGWVKYGPHRLRASVFWVPSEKFWFCEVDGTNKGTVAESVKYKGDIEGAKLAAEKLMSTWTRVIRGAKWKPGDHATMARTFSRTHYVEGQGVKVLQVAFRRTPSVTYLVSAGEWKGQLWVDEEDLR